MPTHLGHMKGDGRYGGVIATGESKEIFQAMDPERDEDIALMKLVWSYARERGVDRVSDHTVRELAKTVINESAEMG